MERAAKVLHRSWSWLVNYFGRSSREITWRLLEMHCFGSRSALYNTKILLKTLYVHNFKPSRFFFQFGCIFLSIFFRFFVLKWNQSFNFPSFSNFQFFLILFFSFEILSNLFFKKSFLFFFSFLFKWFYILLDGPALSLSALITPCIPALIYLYNTSFLRASWLIISAWPSLRS